MAGQGKGPADRRCVGGDSAMMSTRQIFISHSSEEDDDSWHLTGLLECRLREAGHHVFLDRETVHRREEWEDQLRDELRASSVLVAVISEKALDSWWVQLEANLSWVHQRPAVVVLLDGVTHDDLEEAGLKVLDRWQIIDGSNGFEKVVKQVAEVFAYLRKPPDENERVTKWIERMALILGERSAGREFLRRAASELFPDEGQGALSAERYAGEEFLARALLAAGLGRTVPATVEYLNAGLSPGAGRKLAEQLVPTWVSYDRACGLEPVEGAGEGRFALLNATYHETVEHYIHRAMCRELHRFTVISMDRLEGGDPEAAPGYVEQLTCELREKNICTRDGRLVNNGEQEVYVVVPVQREAARKMLVAVVGEIRQRHSFLHIVAVLKGDFPPDEKKLKEWKIRDAAAICPSPGESGEQEFHNRIERMLKIFDERRQRGLDYIWG